MELNMKRMAMIKNGEVYNIAEWDGVAKWEPEVEYLSEIPDGVRCDMKFKFKKSKNKEQVFS